MMYSTVVSSARIAGRKALGGGGHRGFATRRIARNKMPIAQSVLQNLPAIDDGGDDEEPELQGRAKVQWDQFLANRKPISSAHAVDTQKGEISTKDSAAINASGTVVHGRYGELGPAADAIPLEYLALLRPAAEGAAALRTIAQGKSPGTLLVCNATEANGMAAAQLGTAAGHTVVAVVGGEHSGNDQMMECMKGLMGDPGTAVPDVYALAKKNFMDLVESIASGEEGIEATTSDEYVEEFKELYLDYVKTFPEHLPAAVDPEMLKFKGMDKDREFFRENMEAYLAQYPPGSPPVDSAKLEALFTKDQYEIFRKKFWAQTSGVISGDELNFFSPPHLVKELVEEPENLGTYNSKEAGPYYPYSFSVLNQAFPEGSATPAGGPILGAVIAVTPTLEKAAKAIGEAKTLRDKGEALQFLTALERTAYGSAASVAAIARKHGAPVYTIGGKLPGVDSVGQPKEEDVKAAVAGMDVGEDGSTKLNYFVQVYRACDFPFYGDYAVHRATEPMAGPRQIIVSK